MKKQKGLAISFMLIIILQMFFVVFTLLLPYMEKNFIQNKIPEEDGFKLNLNGNAENILEFYANIKPDFAPLRIVTFIGQNAINYDKDFAYLAAIPVGLYNESGIHKVSPILFDDLDYTQEYFLTDWKEYCAKFGSWDGIKNIVYIGNISTETKSEVEDLLNPEMLRNTAIPAVLRQPVSMIGNNTYDLAAQIATYFWYEPDTVVIAAINDTFPAPQTTSLKYSDTLSQNGLETRSGVIDGTHLENWWWNTNFTQDSGGIFVEINNTNDLAMDLFGNFSESIPWMYDTNNISRTNWVFFPNVSYPASISDWGLKVYNRIPVITPIPYSLNFTVLTYQTYQIPISNSESRIDIFLNWTSSMDDLNFWVLDPSHQLVGASSRWGNTLETGRINKTSTILYPANGTWTILVTRPNGVNPIPYNLSVNITEFSSYRRQCIESAANGAIIASILNKPLLYVTNATLPYETEQALSVLYPDRAIFVDPFNLISENVFNNISALNVNLTLSTNLTSRTSVYDFIYSITHEPDLVLSSINDGYFAPASLLAAFHGAPLLPTLTENYNIHSGALKNFAIDSWVGFQNPGNSGLLNQSIPRFEDMKELADVFYQWLDSVNLNKAGNETVLVVSPITELNPFFDRAIYGKALVGRFTAQDAGDLATFVSRNILYPALSYSKLSYTYESRNVVTFCGGNSTITGMLLNASNFSGDHSACQFNDEIYHSYYNGSDGQIFMAYYVNLSEFQIYYDNISQIEVQIEGKIGYSNESIQAAGWGIWNWTGESLVPINDTILNSTSDHSDQILINSSNIADLVLPNNSRIEIFIYVNTSGPAVSASIDFIQFNVTFDQILNKPLMLSSSITYWHNFSLPGNQYNFSSLIPSNFTQNGYYVENKTGYQEIYSQLTDNCKFWYYSGNSTLNETGSQEWLNTLFTIADYWRAFGDQDDLWADVQNPDADGDHLVTPNETLGIWQSMSQINSSLSQLPSTFVLLQTGYLGFSLIPKYLIEHGATVIIANLKQTELGYSEYFSYLTINELLNHNSIGEAMFKAFNQTSHLYSQNWEGSIVGTDSFSNYTEDYQQFILYGDPELILINKTYDLAHPTSYRPLIHRFDNEALRNTYEGINVSITDLDSNLETEVHAIFSINGTIPELQNNISHLATYDPTYNVFIKFINFNSTTTGEWESLGVKSVSWRIYDTDNEIQLTVPLHLLTNPPFLVSWITQINDTGVFNDITHPAHDKIGRVNESFFGSFRIWDIDQDESDPENQEFNVTLILRNINDDSNITVQMENQLDGDPWDIGSNWSCRYHFGIFNTTGQYQILIRMNDSYGGVSITNTVEFFYLINWIPEQNGTNYVITNGTGVENQIFRKNETLEVYTSVFDVDGNQTHVINVTTCFYKDPNQWINISMTDPESDNNWTGSYKFTIFNESGIWNLFIKVTDKDNLTVLLDPNVNTTVMNHPPDQPFNLTMRDFNLTDIIAILRNNTIQLSANATDFDVFNRTENLSLYAVLRDPSGIVRYEMDMTYSNGIKLWGCNFTPQTTDPIGNWTFYVSVIDEANARTNSTGLNLTILNNMPIIQTINIVPTSSELFVGEDLFITGTVIDVEILANITVFIEDDDGKRINGTAILSGQSFDFEVKFEEANYTALKDTGTWNITIRLFDADGAYTDEFSFGVENNSVIIIVRPRQTNGGRRFPIEIVIAIAIVVTAVLATYLVYRTRKREAAVVPAARVKQIIKKISKEKEDTLTEARADIKARIQAKGPKPSPQVTILPEKKKELSEEEREKINTEIRKLVKEAQNLLDKNQFEAAAVAYHDASQLASKLEKHEIAKVYLGRGEEILEKKSELKKKAKREAKEEKKKRKPKEKISRAEAEQIKADIGEIMRSARMAISEDDYFSAAKQYREVADLYRKIGDEEKAKEFEEKADELL